MPPEDPLEPARTAEALKKNPGDHKISGLLWFFSGKILWVCFVALTVGVVSHLFLSSEGLMRSSGLMERKRSLEADNRDLEEANRQLSASLERIRADAGYLEHVARRKLGLVRRDEVVFRLAEEPELSGEESLERLD